MNDDIEAIQVDVRQVLGFIKKFCAGWPKSSYVQVEAIPPVMVEGVKPDIARKTVSVANTDELGSWLKERQKYNLYFRPNPLGKPQGSGKGGAATKADIAAAVCYHVDLDPAEPPAGASVAEKRKHLADERTRILCELKAFPEPPTFIIDTGGGYQAFWQPDELVTVAEAETVNQRLCAHFKTPDHCWSIQHLMRLPGTTNHPGMKKQKNGRTTVPTQLLVATDVTCPASVFAFLPTTAPKTQATMPPTDIGEPIRLDDYGLTPEQQMLVAGENLPDRSKVMHGLLLTLLDDGHPREDVLATIYTEPKLWHGYIVDKHPGDPEAFALAELGKAWGESFPGLLARVALKQEWAWMAEPDAVKLFIAAPPFEKSRLATAIRFDASPTTLDELDAEDPPQKYVIEPIYPLEIPIEFAGAHGIGKSINGVEQCCCVGAGRPWQGLMVMQGKSVFASWEDPRRQIMRRVKTWLRNIKDPAERAKAKRALAKNLVVLGCDEIDLMLTTKAFGACSARDDAIKLIIESCQGAILIMLETAALMHGGDELNEDLAQLAKAVKLITHGTRASVVTVRHVSKDAARNRVVDAYVGRGGGSFSGAMRSMVVLVDVPTEDVRKKGIGLGSAAVDTGRPVLAYHHVKANYGGKMKEPIYLVVMPDGHMERVAGPNEREAQSGLLLEWFRENMEDGGLSFTAIRKARKHFGNPPQGMVRVLLECLKNKGHVEHKKVPGRGRTGEVEKWELVKPV
jgi:hypothetical protein